MSLVIVFMVLLLRLVFVPRNCYPVISNLCFLINKLIHIVSTICVSCTQKSIYIVSAIHSGNSMTLCFSGINGIVGPKYTSCSF